MQVLSFFLVLLDLTSEAALATSFHSQLQPRLPCPSVNEFWDSKLNFCVRCRVCAVVTLRECSATSNTVCGNSYTQGVKERVKNASTSKKELFQKWKGRSSNDNRDSIVSGMIKYSEDDDVGRGRGGVTGRGHHRRRGPGNDLHSDLKAIERELLFDGSSGEIPPLESLGATDSPNIVIGKKRFYEDEPAYDGDYASSHESDDMYLDGSSSSVYGQVVVDPQQQQEQQRQQEEQSSQQKTEGSPRGPGVVMVKAGPDAADEEEKKHDEFGLLHSILQERKEKEAAAAAKAANSKTGPLSSPAPASTSSSPAGNTAILSLVQEILLACLVTTAIVSLCIILAFKKWKEMQRLKIQDNCTPAQNLLSSSHNSSFHRSTDSRLTNRSSVPNSPSISSTNDLRLLSSGSCSPHNGTMGLALNLNNNGGGGSGNSSDTGSSKGKRTPSPVVSTFVDERGRTRIN